MRTTKTMIRARVQGLKEQGCDIDVHWAYGRPRVTTADQTRDLSPRLPMGEMSTWLAGFQAGLIHIEDTKRWAGIDKKAA